MFLRKHMKKLRLLSELRLSLSLILISVFLAACAAGTPTVAPAQPEVVVSSATPPSMPNTETSSQSTAIPTEALVATEIPVATSRGPELHATDPATVKLASGGLQFVEFFRFT